MLSKRTSLTILGRRNKQQILKDFARPSPANTVSGPVPTLTGGTGDMQNCAPPPGQPAPGSPGSAVGHEIDMVCARTWSHGGVFTDPITQEIILDEEVAQPAWFLIPSMNGVQDGSLSGTPINLWKMDARGPLDVFLFGASYQTWQNVSASMASDCAPGTSGLSEAESGIYGILRFEGDYVSDPEVDYVVFGVGESSAYQCSVGGLVSGGNLIELKYYASDRHVFGTLSEDISLRPLATDWIFDQWVVQVIDTDADTVTLIPTGVFTHEVPYSKVIRTDPDTGIRSRTIRIGDYEHVSTGLSDSAPNDFTINVDRTVEWRVGVGASEHLIHYNAAYKGPYEPLLVSFEGSHRFYVDLEDYEDLPSNSRRTLPMENTGIYTWEYPWQDIAFVYNVFVEGVYVHPDKWTWDPNALVLTFNYAVPPSAFVLADSTVQ